MTNQPLTQMLMVAGFQFTLKNFAALDTLELMRIYRIRQSVFVVEQNCAYSDIDDDDLKAWHLFYQTKTAIDGYARLLIASGTDSHIGRVVVAKKCRQSGMGRALMNAAIDICIQKSENQNIIISAQSYLADFYRSLGFQDSGQYYLEDEIPHQRMCLHVNIRDYQAGR